MELFLSKEIQTDFKAKGDDVKLVAPYFSILNDISRKEVVLHELRVAKFDRVFGSLHQAMLNEKFINNTIS